MWSFIKEILPDFSWIREAKGNLRAESISALTSSFLVIPQAIMFAYLIGLSPDYGIYSAIIVTLIASLFGTSPMQGGPNTAIAILIGMAVVPYAGPGSPLFIEYVLIISVMVGIIQMLFWITRGAILFDYFSPPAIRGIVAGVGFILIISSIDSFVGLERLNSFFFYEKFLYLYADAANLINYKATSIALVTVISGLILKRIVGSLWMVFAILTGSVYGMILVEIYPQIESDIEKLGYIGANVQFSIPNFTNEHYLVAQKLIYDALMIAFVGIAQSLIITKSLSLRLNRTYNKNKEVFAQGLSSIAAGFFNTFSGSGSFNRTNLAVSLGSRTPLAGILSAFILIILIFVMSPVLAHVPMPVLAGVLMLSGINMMSISEVSDYINAKEDLFVFLLIFISIILFGLKVGIVLSLIISAVLYIARTSKITYKISSFKENTILAIRGNVFYGNTDQFRDLILSLDCDSVLIDLESVGFIDSSAVNEIISISKANGACIYSILVNGEAMCVKLKLLGLENNIYPEFKDWSKVTDIDDSRKIIQ
jgi:SulP family sulfate permease